MQNKKRQLLQEIRALPEQARFVIALGCMAVVTASVVMGWKTVLSPQLADLSVAGVSEAMVAIPEEAPPPPPGPALVVAAAVAPIQKDLLRGGAVAADALWEEIGGVWGVTLRSAGAVFARVTKPFQIIQ